MKPELIPVTYSTWLVLLSFLVSAVGAHTALSVANAAIRRGRPGRPDRFNLALAGAALGGMAIWSMHFIAMAAATAALWLAFNTERRLHSAGAAALMAAAVCTMHCVGMSAASVICTSRTPTGILAGLARPEELPLLVTVVALGVLLVIGLDLMMQRMTTHERRVGGQTNR